MELANARSSEMNNPISRYFRCSGLSTDVEPMAPLSSEAGYFRFGEDAVLYGRSAAGARSGQPDEKLYDALGDVSWDSSRLRLPFDPNEIAENLHGEKYAHGAKQAESSGWDRLTQAVYYSLRPMLPLAVRKHLQKLRLRDWRKIPFPQWPVDRTVDLLMQRLLLLAAANQGVEKVPFVWFWPDGASACSIMTHDVEAEAGKRFTSDLMTINEHFEIPASFQIVPEKRYEVSREFLDEIKARGFEVNVQDLDHDGRLFRDRKEFSRRAVKINQYAREFGADGFRSAILYRNQDWFELLHFQYDMSVPNVAHLDPQRGGCCTVMPYFIGDMLELPVTTTQDHTLFNVLNDYSLQLWEQQIELIAEHHGLISFIVHPDYILSSRPQTAYKLLLELLAGLRRDRNVWMALPGEVDRWWRQRAEMNVAYKDGNWVVEGPGHERARVAFACVDGGRITYDVPDSPVPEVTKVVAKSLSVGHINS
jgi:hypothetical protein